MTRHIPVVLALVLSVAGLTHAAPPKVVITAPDNGEIDVDPATEEIRIEFDQPMDARGRSIVGGGEQFPKFANLASSAQYSGAPEAETGDCRSRRHPDLTPIGDVGNELIERSSLVSVRH